MFTLDMNARPASRDAKQISGLKLSKLVALLKRPQPVPYDYAEIKRFKLDLEMKKTHMSMLSRLM